MNVDTPENKSPEKTAHVDGFGTNVGPGLNKLAESLALDSNKSAVTHSSADSLIPSSLKAAINSASLPKTVNTGGIAGSFDASGIKAASEAADGAYSDFGKSVASILDNSIFKGFDYDSLVPKLPTANLTVPDYTIPDLSYQVAGYNTYWQQLIIIGNGFDLQCGLRSKFGDFLMHRFEQISQMACLEPKAWTEIVEEHDLTVWDYILEANVDSLWCDIEGVIEKWVLSANATPAKNSPFTKTVEHIKVRPFTDNGCAKSRQSENRMLDNIACYAWTIDPSIASDGYNRERFMALLKHDLRRLERAFGKYLADELANNREYAEKSKRLYELIERDGKKEGDNFITSTSVLSFNYTEAIRESFDGGDDGVFVNIHGKLGGEIIFGIDGKDCMDNTDAVSFTKTYRLMQMGGSRTDKLINTANSSNLQDATDVIKFYGHSLGRADYSYFQSIFDGVDLYESKTVLVFYHPYDTTEGTGADSERWRTDITNKVNNLLVAYGKTMGNQDHGKNLMHKLLLEGRLLIRGIHLD